MLFVAVGAFAAAVIMSKVTPLPLEVELPLKDCLQRVLADFTIAILR